MIYAKLCKSVPHCSKLCESLINLCKMSETYLFGYSLAQFYTVEHTYARLSTKIISTRVSLPFIKELEGFTKNFFRRLNTNIVFSMKNKLNNIIVLGKNKNIKFNNSNVIYKINCDNCNSWYVGQTCRRLGVRIKEHRRKYLEEDNNSSLYIHKTENNHTINFQNVKILNTESNTSKKLFTEALYIHTQKNFMNKQFEITKLPKEYSILINNFEFLSS